MDMGHRKCIHWCHWEAQGSGGTEGHQQTVAVRPRCIVKTCEYEEGSQDVFIGWCRDLEALEGINRPWLYVGGLGSSFAAHQEDCTLTGVNYMVDTSACHVDLTSFKVCCMIPLPTSVSTAILSVTVSFCFLLLLLPCPDHACTTSRWHEKISRICHHLGFSPETVRRCFIAVPWPCLYDTVSVSEL